MLGTNPWFKKPRAIGEKVDSFRMVLKVKSGERSPKKLLSDGQSKIRAFIVIKIFA